MTERLSYERYLEFEKIMQAAVRKGRMNAVAARDGLEHVKVSSEIGNHNEARLYVDGIMEGIADA